MVWLAPGWLILLPLIALPWLIYRLGRKSRVAVPFSAFPWLQAVHQRIARWQRWRRFCILLGRAVLLLLLLLALAQPTAAPLPQEALGSATAQRCLLVLDTSPSMDYQWRGKSLAQWGKQLALDWLAKQPLTTPIIAISSKGQLLAESKPFDRTALRRDIEQLSVEPGDDNLQIALQQGLQQHSEGESFTHVILVSDLAAHNWPGGAVPQELAAQLTFVWLDCAVGRKGLTALPNLAIEQVVVRFGLTRSEERLLDVRVANFGEQAIVDLPISCTLNGELVARGTISLGPKSRADKQFQLSLPALGQHTLQVALEPSAEQDGLLADNQLSSPLWHGAPLRLLLLNGAPSTLYTQDELFFVERALSATTGGDAGFVTQVQSAHDAPAELTALQTYDVVLLANVASLLPLQRAALSQFVEQGGGLVIAMGDRVDLAWMNQHMESLLPHLLRDRQQATQEGQGGVGVGEVPLEELIWQDLDEPFVTGLQASRTKRYVHVESGGAGNYRILLRFADGAPLLLQGVGSRQREKLLLWTTSLDVDDSDLALRPAFVPLIQRLLRYAAGKPQQWRQPIGQIGGTLRLRLPRQVQSVAYCEQDHACKPATLLEQGRVAELGPLQFAGLVRIVLEDGQGKSDAPELSFATQPNLLESDFTAIEAPRSDNTIVSQAFNSPTRHLQAELAGNLTGLCFLLLCALLVTETALLVR